MFISDLIMYDHGFANYVLNSWFHYHHNYKVMLDKSSIVEQKISSRCECICLLAISIIHFPIDFPDRYRFSLYHYNN